MMRWMGFLKTILFLPRWRLLPLVFLILPGSVSGQNVGMPVAEANALRSDLTGIVCDNEMRRQAVRDLLAKHGAGEHEITSMAYKKVTNLAVEVPGTSPERVVVGAHYDKSRRGCGAIDNWSGIVILAHLYKAIRATKPNKTFVFVAFGREEEGLLGSKAMVDAIPKEERANYCAMVNLDSFGMGRPQVLENASTGKLTRLAQAVARENDIPFASGIAAGNSDSSSFRSKGIPAVTLHGLAGRFSEVLHSSADTERAVNLGSVYLGYQFALLLVQRLDSCDCSELR
ncbi:MAG: Zn-dependent exopeptidase M28 [Acidobacteria bacterium]|nr:MAG: Zn-dependent exopeptidase M28 [Acidobacteriota bacterium]